MKWESVSNLIVAIAPVVLTMLVAHATWVTGELYAAKYQMLTEPDGQRITREAEDYTDDKFNPLMAEILRIREVLDKQSITLAETLTEVRMLRESSTRLKDST